MLNNIKKKEFWIAAAIRAVRTMCQVAITLIGGAIIMSDVNWPYLLSACLLSGIVSILTSIVTGLPEVD